MIEQKKEAAYSKAPSSKSKASVTHKEQAQAVGEIYQIFFGPGARIITAHNEEAVNALEHFRQQCLLVAEDLDTFSREWKATLDAAQAVVVLVCSGKLGVTCFGGEA